jgi:hypothetical protein
MQQVGATLGLSILITVFGSASRSAAASGATGVPLLVDGMTAAFVVAAVLAGLSFLVALTFRRQENLA